MAPRRLAEVLGVALLLPTLALVLGASLGRVAFREDCEVPGGEAQALFDYMSLYSCAEVLPLPARIALLLLWLALLISLLASTADNFFVPQLDALSRDLQMSEDVAGVTLLALGNGMPDVMTATSAINKADDFSLTMGEFFGAANFILGFVLGCVLLCEKGSVSVSPRAFIRDAVGYGAVVALMVAATWDGTVYLDEALFFFVVYAVYVAAVIFIPVDQEAGAETQVALRDETMKAGEQELPPLRDNVRRPYETPRCLQAPADDNAVGDEDSTAASTTPREDDMQFVLLESDAETDDEAHGGDGGGDDPLEGLDTSAADGFFSTVQLVVELPFTLARHVSIPAANWNSKRRRLAAICPACGLQVALLSFGGWEAFEIRWGAVPLWLGLWVVGVTAGGALLAASTPYQRPRWHPVVLIFAFACTIGWFNLLANECVAVLETFGLNFGISSSVLGITVLAWGNSVGDLVADTSLARQGKSRTAVAGCFGSPMLSDVLGLGVAFTSYTLSHGPLQVRLSLQNKVAAAILATCIVLTTAAFIMNNYRCPRRFGYVLVVAYGIFMVLSVAMESSAHLRGAVEAPLAAALL